ncbi:hypothetical protein [Halarcobacter anaerophilus]|uniref:hypothetical protein n=1 Tax=Halarcobacter anaerophilus TaxID=877500 RepID=UPI000A6A83EB|nr:hypothetical protein [Halarcobacter anaerophilus]
MGYSCIKQGDPFSSFIGNKTLELCTKKSKRNFAVTKMSEKVFDYNAIGKEVDFQKLSDELFKKLEKNQLFF